MKPPTRKIPIDRIGLALLFVWVGALQIMLDKGKDLTGSTRQLSVAHAPRHGRRLCRLAHMGTDRGASHRGT